MLVPTPSLLGRRVTRFKPPFFQHDGTCVDHTCHHVVDTIPGTNVRLTTIATYADGWPVAIKPNQSTRTPHQRAQHALAVVGTTPYDAWYFNCQHLAELIENGNTRRQETTQRVILGVGLLALAFWVARD
jgi:hypothetical protein